ncbi:hypothetical protein GCM10011611_19160 [Aliidongia dinghuensis]|uniref:FkbM family methyltransferase n=1 Tax=Aliidongia dinghuensis TaxID=1867774 RepID=A0A8J3E2W3_9PROT|nr:FkbM family methyltransferase [Aliidongia dinghuensis]GGF13595.1 hypothetical protein GCM10011611_19160 [Aliidongia dinghuensis]
MTAFVSYAQNFEDVMLWRALKHVEKGFYIDVGANDPTVDSVTKAFYARRWHGINIEPTQFYFDRLAHERPDDINLRVAAGSERGMLTLHEVPQTGLSTPSADIAAQHRREGFDVDTLEVEVLTLNEICAAHVTGDIHFLKIDVEGGEQAVLQGFDLERWRPWILVIEATRPNSQDETFDEWEPLVLAHRYRFAYADGLNRFYVAEEHAELTSALHYPPNVFDGFTTNMHEASVIRMQESEARAARSRHALQDQIVATRAAEDRARKLEADLRTRAKASEEESRKATLQITELKALLRTEIEKGRINSDMLRQREAQLQAPHRSHSWRITAALRAATFVARGRVGSALIEAGMPPARAERLQRVGGTDAGFLKRSSRVLFYVVARAAARLPGSARVGAGLERIIPGPWQWLQRRDAAYKASALMAPVYRGFASTRKFRQQYSRSAPTHGIRPHKVHQFHSGSAVGDAVTNSMFLIQAQLRAMGYESDIFVEHRAPDLADRLLEIDDLPQHADYALIVHHSMGYDAFGRILALPVRKVLMYHNITPSEFLDDSQSTRAYAELGLRQLEQLRPHVSAALAASEYNALELRAYGYDAPIACPLLFDASALIAKAGERPNRRANAPFTILFVGRVVASKGQAELVDAFAEFRRAWGEPCRLVLVGRAAAPDAPYPTEISRRITQHGLQDEVFLTGPVSDSELHAWYGEADVYVSLSKHEGFGVPLIEAMAHDVPVIAWPCGAVPYTLGGAGVLLADRSPGTVAAAILDLAASPERRREIVARQRAVLDGFRLEHQMPHLVQALLTAGAASPRDATVSSVVDNMRVAVTGHINGTYSLATINRMMALTYEAHVPGAVRIIPWENGPVDDLSGVPSRDAQQVAALASRPAPPTGPEFVISQHYPVLVPENIGNAAFALFAWEESLVPPATIDTLAAGFNGVFVPAASVAKALVDSGLPIPVRTTGQPPDLDEFYRLGLKRRAARHEDGHFTFLHVSSCFPRKGVDVLLAAYARAFRKTDHVRLVIKGFPNPHNDVPEQIEALRIRDPDVAEIVMINEDLDIDRMLELYADADSLVLPTRGEGFNLPAAEAMAAGVPLIVTGYGGHLDFCKPTEARFVDFRFQPSGSHVAVSGSVWVEPDQDDLTAALREAFEDGFSGGSADRARRAQAAVRRRLDHKDWVRRVRAAAVEALTAPPSQPLRVAWISTWGVRCGVAEYSRFLMDYLAQPDGGRTAPMLVLADGRTPPSTEANGLHIDPSWALADSDSLDDLARAVAAADSDAIVIQHQPGLILWPDLAHLLKDQRIRNRITVVTLHAALHLLDLPEEERSNVVDALRGTTRILVHRVADLNLLKDLGLTANVTLFPHGVPPRAPTAAARPLTPSDAPVIGCYGFFLPGKGIPRLIESVAQLRQAWPNLKLRLVNAEYPAPESAAEIERCRQLAAALGVSDAIEWDTAFNPHETSMRQLSSCDLLVLPYDESKESASGAVRIALSSGVPVAVTPTAIFEEANDAVHRFAAIDVAAMVSDLDQLLRDQPRRAHLQEITAAWLAERSWDILARRLKGMLHGLRASKSLRAPLPLEDIDVEHEGATAAEESSVPALVR